MRLAKPLNEIMGGFIVLFFGDFNQLQPVGDIPLYGVPKSNNLIAIQGQIVYRHIKKVFKLTQIMRQIGFEQESFRDCLSRIAMGEISLHDYELLQSRFMLNNEATISATANVLRLISTNAQIEQYNEEKLRALGKPIAIIQAIHNDPRGALASNDEAKGLCCKLHLCKGAQVILRQNLFTAAGLCNGTIGHVTDILYTPTGDSTYVDEFPKCVMVQFDSYSGPMYNNSKILPIVPITASFQKGAQTYTRKQFPLQPAYAISIHRSQGITLDKAVIDLGNTEFALGMTYVALSRVRSIQGLFLEPFSFERLKKINDKKGLTEKRLELQRLEALI